MMTKEDSTVFEPQRIAFGDPLVDIHHHVIPPDYLDALARSGMDTSAFPSWAPEESLQVMDRLGIGRAMLSLSSPGVWFGDDSKARSLARACNEYVAGLRKERPSRFGGLAVLPLPQQRSGALPLLQILPQPHMVVELNRHPFRTLHRIALRRQGLQSRPLRLLEELPTADLKPLEVAVVMSLQ